MLSFHYKGDYWMNPITSLKVNDDSVCFIIELFFITHC